MPHLNDQDEIDAYYMADPVHPRAAGIMWPIIVERRVDNLFKIALRPDEKVHNELFRPSGALGNYGVKVQLAYLLGWIGEDIFKDLVTISKIRNRFAHHIEVKDFSDQKIEAWLNNLRGSILLPEMLEHARREAEVEAEETTKLQPERPAVSKRGIVFNLEGIAKVPQSRFRWCIDLMIQKLDEYARHMKHNLENLPGSWLVGEPKPE
jgi:hypothetical protein